MPLTTDFRRIWLVLLLAPMLVLPSTGYGQEEEMVLGPPAATAGGHRPAVTFSHGIHMEAFDCLVCHHDYADGENVLDEGDLEEGNPDIRCSACHDTDSTPDLMHAYHRQCIGCHRRLRIGGEKTGPELCGECHKK